MKKGLHIKLRNENKIAVFNLYLVNMKVPDPI